MRAFQILISLYIGLVSAGADEIPVRAPNCGESRPVWWLNCWLGHIVVVEGKFSYKESDNPHVEVKLSKGALDELLDKSDAELQAAYSKFFIGKIEIKRLVFASEAITSENGNIAQINNGNIITMNVLVPALEHNGKLFSRGAKHKDEGVFVFRYGSSVATIPMVYAGKLDEEEMKSASLVFEHRNRYDYRRFKYEPAEQDADDQLPARAESEAE